MSQKCILILLFLATAVLAVANLLLGSLDIPVSQVARILLGHDIPDHPQWRYIIIESRVPQMFTTLFAGAALSTSGLMLQTLFRNPLAGPSILGIDSGANLGVAFVMLLLGGSVSVGSLSMGGFLLVIIAALLGALGIMALLLMLSVMLKNQVMLLITGVIISYVTGSVISLLNYSATEQGVHSFMVWGMGNFSSVSLDRLPLFCGVLLLCLLCAMLLIKPLDALLLGDRYASNLGVNVQRIRHYLLLCTGVFTAVTTAFCGPVSFLGLAVPHIARMSLRTSSHRVLMPGTMLTGACIALLCNLVCTSSRDGSILPVNVITPLIGAPVILYVILKKRY